jgi:O-antigen ligase
LQTNTTFQQGIVRPGNLAGRVTFWNWALPIATSSPHNLVFGVGATSLETPAISTTAPLPAAVAEVPVAFEKSLHSQYVTTLVEQGLIGLAALAFLLLAPFVAGARTARGHPAGGAAAASVLAFAIMSVAGNDLLHGPSFALLLVAAGIAATLRESTSAGHPVPTAMPGQRSFDREALGYGH